MKVLCFFQQGINSIKAGCNFNWVKKDLYIKKLFIITQTKISMYQKQKQTITLIYNHFDSILVYHILRVENTRHSGFVPVRGSC